MHQSSKAFFEKDSVLMWSAVCAMVLWIINGALNLAAGSYTSFFINLFYVICLLTLCAAEFRGQKNVVQGMIGALMMVFAMGNVNVLLAIIPMLNAVICIECRGDAYIV